MMSHLHAGLSSETTEKARLELNENPDTLHQDIQQVHGCTTQLRSAESDEPQAMLYLQITSTTLLHHSHRRRDQLVTPSNHWLLGKSFPNQLQVDARGFSVLAEAKPPDCFGC